MAPNPSQTLQEDASSTGVGWPTIIAAGRRPFQVLTTTLLSLLLPLSYLLLARLATAGYLLSVSENHPNTSLVTSYFIHTKNPTILHLISSIIAVAALSDALIGKTASLCGAAELSMRRRVYAAWLFLVTLQVCVGVEIQGSIAACVEGSSFGQESNLACRLVFFLGLHETMLFWWRRVVKPVVDDTIFGCWREEVRVEKVAVGLSYGGLWWWRLRDEVEALVVVPEVKREMMMGGIGMVDFFGWWLYYVTAILGILRIVKALFSILLILTRPREVCLIPPNDPSSLLTITRFKLNQFNYS